MRYGTPENFSASRLFSLAGWYDRTDPASRVEMNGSAALDTGSALPEVLIKRKKLLKLHTGGRRFLTQISLGEKGTVYVYGD